MNVFRSSSKSVHISHKNTELLIMFMQFNNKYIVFTLVNCY